MRKLFYMGLESYVARYSFQLETWNTREFDRLGINYHIVRGQNLDESKEIKTGSVLDAHGRSYWSLTQHAELIRLMQNGEITNQDVVFYEDMFTPGIESVAYAWNQISETSRPKIFVRCLAQTIDPDDFVHRTGMFEWMSRYEHMVDELVAQSGGGILCASEEMIPNLRIRGFKSPLYVTGLPFGKSEVQEYVEPVDWKDRPKKVVFAARWDSEKQPDFFRDVVNEVTRLDPEVSFYVLTGHKQLKSDIPRYSSQEFLDSFNNLTVLTGLQKHEYYRHLANSRVLFNCALQDWVSNTVSEADTLGCMTIYPAYRSFPEVFANNPDHMYVPWSVEDASSRVLSAVRTQTRPSSIGKASHYQNGTIERTVNILQGLGEQHRRLDGYRKYTRLNKY